MGGGGARDLCLKECGWMCFFFILFNTCAVREYSKEERGEKGG